MFDLKNSKKKFSRNFAVGHNKHGISYVENVNEYHIVDANSCCNRNSICACKQNNNQGYSLGVLENQTGNNSAGFEKHFVKCYYDNIKVDYYTLSIPVFCLSKKKSVCEIS